MADKLYLKFVLVGDHTVGKTSVAQRFASDYFPTSYKPTVGVDFYQNTLLLPGDLQAEVEVWDVGGASLHSHMTRNYLYGANAVFLVYDVTNYTSFQLLDEWLRALEVATGYQLPRLVLLGNKTDLVHLRTVKAEDHLRFAETHQMKSFFTSTKTKDAFLVPFLKLAADCMGLDVFKNDADVPATVLKAMVIQSASSPVKTKQQQEQPEEDPTKCLLA